MTTGLLITNAGQAAIAADLGGGANLVLTHVAVGDANGVPYAPVATQAALVNERYRMTIASVAVVGSEIVVDAILPADTNDGLGRPSHSFNVWEIGLFSAEGTLIGVARMSGGYKPPPSSGQAAIATFRLKLAVANPSAITVVVDPQAQIIIGRHVRPFWVTVNGHLAAPPPAPSMGDTYAVALGATGAWTGFSGRLAQWVGVWSLSQPPLGHMVSDASQDVRSPNRYLRSVPAGWTSADAGAAGGGFVSPGTLRKQSLNWRAGAIAGDPDELTMTLDPPIQAMAEITGTPLRFVALSDAVSASNISIDGLPPVSIVYPKGEAIRSKAWLLGETVEIVYDGVLFRFRGAVSPDQVQSGQLLYGVASVAAANAWTVLLDPAPPAGLIQNGFVCRFNAPAAPTGPVGLTIAGVAGNLVGSNGFVIEAGDLIQGAPVEVMFANGVGWQVLSHTSQTTRALRSNLPIHPEMTTGSGLANLSLGPGVVQVGNVNTMVFRGFSAVSAASIPVGQRTFATAASRVYHLRWRAPWHAAPGFALVDVTALGAGEAAEAYDSTYDDALIALIATDAGNAPSAISLLNKAQFYAIWSKTTFETNTSGYASFAMPTLTLNYGRRPKAVMETFNVEWSVDYEALTYNVMSATRYQVQAASRAIRLIGNSFSNQEYVQGQHLVRIDG